MESKKTTIIACIQEIQALHKKEEKMLENLISIVNSFPIEIVENKITRTFGTPLAHCEGCKHQNNSSCDMFHFGCHFETNY